MGHKIKKPHLTQFEKWATYKMTSTMEGIMMVVKGGCFKDVGDVLFPGSRALVYSGESMPMVGFRPVVKMR
jgi:hypothetical protein